MSDCLICGITRNEVDAVRARDGYTLGCGIESNTENGFDYEELSPRHRWAPWRDAELDRMGIRAEAFERYRTTMEAGIRYAACADTKRGHVIATDDDVRGWGYDVGQCLACGRAPGSGDPSPTETPSQLERGSDAPSRNHTNGGRDE